MKYNKEWNGPQDGLPPVGTECEIDTRFGWLPGRIVDHGDDYAVSHLHENKHNLKVDWSRTGFRPIQSERDRLLKMAAKELSGTFINEAIEGISGLLFDAGMLVDPERKPMSRVDAYNRLGAYFRSQEYKNSYNFREGILDALGYKE